VSGLFKEASKTKNVRLLCTLRKTQRWVPKDQSLTAHGLGVVFSRKEKEKNKYWFSISTENFSPHNRQETDPGQGSPHSGVS
jgi:hypothetical protein